MAQFSPDIPVLACESYAFHQENIQYTDVIRNPYQKNPIASIMVTLAGKGFIQDKANEFFAGIGMNLFKEQRSVQYEEITSYSFAEYISDLGGAAGLVLG